MPTGRAEAARSDDLLRDGDIVNIDVTVIVDGWYGDSSRMYVAGTPKPFAQRLIAAAPDRVLWGTDWPHPNVRWEPDEADLVDLLPRFGDTAALQRLLVENPARLYGFS